ncbi:hypothetical protein [Mycobacterium sp. NPDC004974]
MTTDQPDPCDQPEPCTPCGDDGGCEPKLINRLKCKPAGIAAQAKSNAENQPAVTAAQDSFDKTRRDYRDARQLYSHDIHDLEHEICSLVERIRCKFKQSHVPDCLDEAYEWIRERLCQCATAEPERNCEFDTDTCDLDDCEFQHLKKKYEDDLVRAHAYFDKLSTEPADLAKRVADAKAEVSKVDTGYHGEDATTDIKEVYAHALMTRHQIKKLWNGFDSYGEYADELCSALVCWTKAADAVAIMAGQDAIRTCHAEARKKRCDDLAANTVKEILARYERICGRGKEDEHECDEREHEHDHECDECGHNHGHGHGSRGDETQSS